MPRWICPRCDREFGRAHQSHVCVPGITVDQCFAGHPEAQREIYDTMSEFLDTLGPYHADAVGVGVFLKSDRKFAEVRPMARALSLELYLPRAVTDRRIARTIRVAADRVVNVILLRRPAELDEQVRAWLAEAYLWATSESGAA